MRFSSYSMIVMLAITCSASSVFAQCTSQCAQTSQCCNSCNGGCQGCNMPLLEAFCMGYRANVNWPAVYVPPARRSVTSAYDAMTNNGWRRQNLLGAYHFDPETNELTQAGKLKVNWILTQTPQHRRSIFVERGPNLSQTASRVASINSWASNISPAIGPVDVNDTHIVAEGHPAGMVDSIFVGFQTNQRPPVLPASSGTSTSIATAK